VKQEKDIERKGKIKQLIDAIAIVDQNYNNCVI
jgi:hypothetical protein